MLDLNTLVAHANDYISPKDVDVVVYHDPCPDGALGAFALWQRFGDDKIQFTPYLRTNINEGKEPFDSSIMHNKNVLFIDCAPDKAELFKLSGIAKKVMVLDHHVSAAEELQGKEGCFFTKENSGAVIAWHYTWGIDKPIPRLFALVQDRDLLQWQHRDSVALDRAIAVLNPTFAYKYFQPFLKEEELQRLIEKGEKFIAKEQADIMKFVKNAKLSTYTCPITNKSYNVKHVALPDYSLTLQVSEILRNQPGVDFCMTYYPEEDNIYRVSMRTAKDANEVDLSIVCKGFGGVNHVSGGGHANKAGCRVNGMPVSYLSDSAAKVVRRDYGGYR